MELPLDQQPTPALVSLHSQTCGLGSLEREIGAALFAIDSGGILNFTLIPFK